jgi:hypothetical protein
MPMAAPEAAPSVVDAVPAIGVGEALPSIEQGGRPYGGDSYLAVLHGETGASTITTIDTATGAVVSGPSVVDLDWSCGLAVVTPDSGVPLVIAQRSVPTPSQGVERGGYAARLVALDVTSLRERWTADVATVPDDGYNTGTYGSCLGDHSGLDVTFRATSDGRAALVRYLRDSPVVVDLETGAERPAPEAVRVLDKWIVLAMGTAPRKIDLPSRAELRDPLTDAAVGATDDVDLARELAQGTTSVAPSGATVVVNLSDVNGTRNDAGLAGFTLPELHQRWALKRAQHWDSAVFVDEDGRAAGYFENPVGQGHTEGAALRFADGQPAWTQRFTAVCAVTASVVTVLANRQLAFLNAADGSQITYSDQVTECPPQLGNDLLIANGRDSTLLRAAR